MNASSGAVRDDKQKLDHDGGLEAASVGGLFLVAYWHQTDLRRRSMVANGGKRTSRGQLNLVANDPKRKSAASSGNVAIMSVDPLRHWLELGDRYAAA
jgi:hypothetical protein